MAVVSEQTHQSFSLSYKDTMSFMKIEGQYFEMFWNIVVEFMNFSIFESNFNFTCIAFAVGPSVNSFFLPKLFFII
jgi:hypothetical protein